MTPSTAKDRSFSARLPNICQAVLAGAIAAGGLLPAVPAGAGETAIYAFAGGKDGAGPEAGLYVRATNGRLFGTTYNGGRTKSGPQDGTVYALTPPLPGQTSWKKQLIYAFTGWPDGRIPWGRLISGKNGVLYGTTLEGGTALYPQGEGTVFQLTPPSTGETGWTETVLYSFKGGSDGSWPRAGLVMDPAGSLYGTTSLEGDPQCNCGTVFMLSPPPAGQTSWTETVIHTFTGGVSDGANAQGEPLFDKNSNALFGATYGGGYYGLGVVYELTPPTPKQRLFGIKTWNETVIHGFTGGTDGAHPNGALLGGAGALFGTTQAGGNTACPGGCGTVFLLRQLFAGNPVYTPFALHSFFGNTTGNPPSDGALPTAGLFKDAHNVLWGTTSEGGGSLFCGDVGCGTVFTLTPDLLRVDVWHYNVFRFD